MNTTAATVILDPMKAPFGLCGPIPSDMKVLSAQKGQVKGIMPAGPCPGLHPVDSFQVAGVSYHMPVSDDHDNLGAADHFASPVLLQSHSTVHEAG